MGDETVHVVKALTTHNASQGTHPLTGEGLKEVVYTWTLFHYRANEAREMKKDDITIIIIHVWDFIILAMIYTYLQVEGWWFE